MKVFNLFLIIIILNGSLLFSQNNYSKNIKNNKDKINLSDKYNKYFIYFSLITGGLFYYNTKTEGNDFFEKYGYGDIKGFNLGSIFSYNNLFALGFGFSLIFPNINFFISNSINNNERFDRIISVVKPYNITYNTEYSNNIYRLTYLISESEINFSILSYLNFMIGNLKKGIAFLFDIGGGWISSVKLGLYYKGIEIKFGYQNYLSLAQTKFIILEYKVLNDLNNNTYLELNNYYYKKFSKEYIFVNIFTIDIGYKLDIMKL